MVDHVKQYKIPREYMYLDEQEKKAGKKEKDEQSSDEDKLEQKMFKPTGPDGRSWGDFRECTATELVIIEELE